MAIKEAFKSATLELVESFGLVAEFSGEAVEPVLASADEVNVTIGLTKGEKGVVLLGMTRETALKIASVMIGSETTELDELAEGAISEFMNTLVGMGLGNFQSDQFIDFSSPTMIVGDNTYLMISRVESSRLQFSIDGQKFCVSISLE
ncbi:MAG: chemotaxis protein CheX [Fibrobacterota bacterium]|nr:chemotaxis protein CheX [Chitinispirillaceae bacterium]